MSNESKNGYVKWSVLALLLSFLGGLLVIIWGTLDRVREDVSTLKSDVAVIKTELRVRGVTTTTSLLDKMYSDDTNL